MNDSLFVRVFYHSTFVDHGKDSWFNNKDIIFVNKKHKFSIIPSLIDIFKINNKYEFLLEYPEFSKTLHWRQKTNPIENVTDVDYESISVEFSSFKGLARSNCYGCSFIDGTPGYGCNLWFYSIGSISKHSSYNIPGYTNGNDEPLTKEVVLWMRIKDSNYIDFLPELIKSITCNKRNSFFSAKTTLIIILVC